MAAKAAADLAGRGRKMSALFASPLVRAQESAAPIAARFNLPIQTEDRIIEPTNRFEGLNFHVRNSALRNPRTWLWLRNPFQPSWGEPYVEIRDRMLAAIQDAWSSVPDGDVILVSHQLPIWTVHSALNGTRLFHDPRKRRCSLSSITTLERHGNSFIEVGYTDPAAELVAQASDVGAV
jgi:broad specificity phosphatase PhoE